MRTRDRQSHCTHTDKLPNETKKEYFTTQAKGKFTFSWQKSCETEGARDSEHSLEFPSTQQKIRNEMNVDVDQHSTRPERYVFDGKEFDLFTAY